MFRNHCCGSRGKGILPLLAHSMSHLTTTPCAPEPCPHVAWAGREAREKNGTQCCSALSFACVVVEKGRTKHFLVSIPLQFKSQLSFPVRGGAGPVPRREQCLGAVLPRAPLHPAVPLPAPFSSQWDSEDLTMQWSRLSPAAQPCSGLCPGTFRQPLRHPEHPLP